jgi:hypothetical protein
VLLIEILYIYCGEGGVNKMVGKIVQSVLSCGGSSIF